MFYSTEKINDFVSKMILSASGWRTIFAESGDQDDNSQNISQEHKCICRLIAYSFAEWLLKNSKNKKELEVALATDTRPTGKNIVSQMIPVLKFCTLKVKYVGVASAPEIMAYAKTIDAFIYISASHNPIGHNGIKFGLNDGGVIDGEKSKDLIEFFKSNCNDQDVINKLCSLFPFDCDVIHHDQKLKQECLNSYSDFFRLVMTGSSDKKIQDEIFSVIKKALNENPIGVACDLNGSARTLSIDSLVFKQNKIPYYTINDQPYEIAHEIIPEPENLVHVAKFMEKLQHEGKTCVKLGFMPDCDGDRGNIVYWNGKSSVILKAQEVFALSVLAELSYMDYLSQKFPQTKAEKVAVSINDPTSMRIEEIAGFFKADVFRAEVGEANVVNLARQLRSQGYQVRILGEGSNGGTITDPSCVRDPINTMFALLKLLCIKDEILPDGKLCYGLFHRWCIYSNQENLYKEDFSLQDVVDSLPSYTTTGVSEPAAVFNVKTKDHSVLKSKYQKNFLSAWEKDKDTFFSQNRITKWRAFSNNGTKQTEDITDFSLSGKGGLKIIFYDKDLKSKAFIWMRGSGTESVFRVMCDVKGNEPDFERHLLEWHRLLLEKSDLMC
ncbi:MAG: phosphoglucomutase [Treponemataceae bacterium]